MADTKTSPAVVALAWIIVGVPLGWGVYKSGLNAVKLFQAAPPAASNAAPTPTPAAK